MKMKKIVRAVAFAAYATMFVGCVSDNGIHFVKLNADDYKCDPVTKDPIPSFRVEAKKPEIADQGRASILGKWRVFVNKDSSGSGITGGVYASGQWEIDVYEFKDDGTYTMRRVAEDRKTTLDNSGEDGFWTYEKGILRLQPKCVVMAGLFSFSEPKRVEVGMASKMGEASAMHEFRIKWHDQSAFTQEYADIDKVKASYANNDRRVREAMGVKEYSTSNIHYDSNGCLHQQVYWSDGRVKSLTLSVTNPRLFRRVNE